MYSLVPKERPGSLFPHMTLFRPNTLPKKGAMSLFRINAKRKTVMPLIRIVLLCFCKGLAVMTLFSILLDSTGSHAFLLDHVNQKG